MKDILNKEETQAIRAIDNVVFNIGDKFVYYDTPNLEDCTDDIIEEFVLEEDYIPMYISVLGRKGFASLDYIQKI